MGEDRGSWGTSVTRGAGKSGSGMDNLPIPKRELSKMINSTPITIRIQSKTSKKIVREFVVSEGLVFQVHNGTYRLINTADNFLHALLSLQ